jgi:hypothetical protein
LPVGAAASDGRSGRRGGARDSENIVTGTVTDRGQLGHVVLTGSVQLILNDTLSSFLSIFYYNALYFVGVVSSHKIASDHKHMKRPAFEIETVQNGTHKRQNAMDCCCVNGASQVRMAPVRSGIELAMIPSCCCAASHS